MSRLKNLILAIVLLTSLLAYAVPKTALAVTDTCTWTGGGVDDNWSNSANWAVCDGNVPQNGDSLNFPTGIADKVSFNDLGDITLGGININDAYTINGPSAITLNSYAAANEGTARINSNLALGADVSFNTSGTGYMVIGGNVDLGTFQMVISNSGEGTQVAGNISGSGNIVIAGGNVVTSFNGHNTYSGQTNVNAGALTIYTSDALGSTSSNTRVADGATLNIAAGGLTVDEDIVISGSGNVGGGALRNFTGNNTWSGDVTVQTSGTEIRSDPGLKLTFTGDVSGTLVNVYLNGSIVFNHSTTMTGTYNLFSGSNVQFNGTNEANVSSVGAIVSGSGSIANLTMMNTGQLNPGTSPGVLTVGNTVLNSTTTMNMELTAGVSDQLNVVGTINLANANLATSLGYNAPNGTQFMIVNNDGSDPVTGIYAGLPEGTTFSTGGAYSRLVQISYAGGTGNDVVLTVVEPALSLNLSSNDNPATAGQNVTFTASLGSHIPAPTGTVSFYDGDTLLGTTALNGSGNATFTTSSLSVGSHNISAFYSGDEGYDETASDVLVQSITAPIASVATNSIVSSPAAMASKTVLADTGDNASIAIYVGLAIIVSTLLVLSRRTKYDA